MTNRIKMGELTAVEDRVRWMLLCRAALAAAVLVVWQGSAGARGGSEVWLIVAVGWPAFTALSLLAARIGRRAARAALTVSLLVDGVLLGLAWWATGTFDGVIGYLVVLHAVAVTLLASFRTGVKLAVWHSVVALQFLEATAAGYLRPAEPVAMVPLWLYLGMLWAAVLGTASFAAANERELRRRRYDSEALRDFGLAVVEAADPAAVVAALARFGRDELSARRAAVLAYRRDDAADGDARAWGAVAGDQQEAAVCRLDGDEPPPGSVLAHATARSATLLLRRVDRSDDPWLAAALPGARNVIVVPFRLEEASGALVLEVGTRRRGARIERRAIGTAAQATAMAAVALERAVLIERIRAAAETDGLTRVANRRRFDEVFPAELERARQTGADLGIALIDIDHFKRLNDTFGHLTGDEVLRLVAKAIRTACGEPHVVARYGGEEFAAILVGADTTAALAVGERIRAEIGGVRAVTAVTASIGVASCPAHGVEPAELLAAADAALYRAKEAGRNRVLTASAAHAAMDAVDTAAEATVDIATDAAADVLDNVKEFPAAA